MVFNRNSIKAVSRESLVLELPRKYQNTQRSWGRRQFILGLLA